MRTENYSSEVLKTFLNDKKIATLSELKIVLGTNVDRTVFRKLQKLSYLTSYSHSGRYYTLDEIAEFNNYGLWFYKDVCFSLYGSLIKTTRSFVNNSECGYSVNELETFLKVSAREPLLVLYRKGSIYRKKLSKTYIYFSIDSKIRRRQILFRQDLESEREQDVERSSTILFSSLLDEKQRRLYAGLESLKHGYGGNKEIGDSLGLDAHTVAKGKQELLERKFREEGIREIGSGRTPIKKKSHKL